MEEVKGFSKDAIVRINKERDIVTKRIIKIIEDKEGEINPITNLQESPVIILCLMMLQRENYFDIR